MLTDKHLQEFAESGICKKIAESVFRSVSDPKQIATFLGWKAYQGPPGWLYEGIDPVTGKPTGIGQFKPDGGFTFSDGSEAKYLSQKGSDGKGKYDACCLPVPGINWDEVVEDNSQPVRYLEGAKKAIASMIHTGIPAIALSGVDMATYGRSGPLTPTIAALSGEGRLSEIAYDADIADNKNVRAAAIAFGRSLKKNGCLVTVRTWSQELGKGIDDAIVNIGVEEFKRQSVVQDFNEWLKPKKKVREAIAIGDEIAEPEPKEPKMPRQSIVARAIAKAYQSKLAWRPGYKRWYLYGAEIDGCWSNEEEDFISRLISMELSARGLEHSAPYLGGILKLLKAFLAVKKWDSAKDLIPAKNGVVNSVTRELSPHSPDYRLTWQLPYVYDPQADCKPIKDWLLETMEGNQSYVELIRSYLYSVIHSRTDQHTFFQLSGPPRAGKGALTRLATAVVGERNTHITKLEKLESRFETASLMDKKLVLITDSDRYGGTVETLKALTGGDALPYEEKHLQSREGFQPECKVIIVCNEPIQAQDYMALQSRRITVHFEKHIVIEKRRHLIDKVKGELVGEFVPYLPGLLNWVLTMDEKVAEAYCTKTEKMVTGYKKIALQAIVSTNPIADWADQHLVYEEGVRLQIGVAKRNRDGGGDNSYINVASWMYPNYAEFCISTGTHLLSLKRFIMLANDLFINQLKLRVKHTRDRVCAFFENLRLRSELDNCGGLISSESATPTPPPTPTPPAEPDWKNFPSAATDSTESRKNKALACRNQLMKAMAIAKCRKDLAAAQGRWTKAEVNWVARNLLSAEQARKLQAILAIDQQELKFD